MEYPINGKKAAYLFNQPENLYTRVTLISFSQDKEDISLYFETLFGNKSYFLQIKKDGKLAEEWVKHLRPPQNLTIVTNKPLEDIAKDSRLLGFGTINFENFSKITQFYL